MSKPKIANWQAKEYVTALKEFMGNNLFAEWTADGERYVVYSYGPHWPLYVFDSITDQWYGNFSHFGRTTTKHFTQSRPTHITGADLVPLHVDNMIQVVHGGITEITG